jgi:polyisoprenyl-teichoic acid--peptidoglycan teichoic acid transferase
MTEISPLGARRRRILPKVLIAVAVAVAAALVAGTIYAFQVDRSITQNITRQDDTLPDDSPTGFGQSPRPTKDPAATGTLNYVLLGSDSRDPNNEGAGRSDSIMLVHLNAKRDMAYIISFPRDMYVQIPGYGRNKINAAFAFGGPKLIVTTLENLTGDRMDHVALIDFEGFIQLTNDLGGVTVYNKTDFSAHGYHFPQGDITIKGEQALYFVRERHQLPRGDFDRAENQRNVIKAIAQKGLSAGVISNPVTFIKFVTGVAKHLTVDSKLSDAEIRDTALSLRLNGNDIEVLQAPVSGTGTTEDGQSIDIVDQAKLRQLRIALRQDSLDDYVKKYPQG